MWKEPRKRTHDAAGAIRGITVPIASNLVLALIVNQDGFPFSYELFDGTARCFPPSKAILRTVERKHGKARRVWIFDRGVVSEENLVAIRKRGDSIWWAQHAAS